MLFAKPYKLWQQQKQRLYGGHTNLVKIFLLKFPGCNGILFVGFCIIGYSCDVIGETFNFMEATQGC